MNEGFDIGQAFEDAVTQVFEYLPVLFGALVLLLVGYLVAKIAGAAVYKALRRFRFDHALHNSAAGKYIARLVDSPSRFVSRITFWLLFLFLSPWP